MKHVHNWLLGTYTRGSLIPIGEKTMAFSLGNSVWLCECGGIKTVTLKEKPSTPMTPKHKQ